MQKTFIKYLPFSKNLLTFADERPANICKDEQKTFINYADKIQKRY